MRQKVSHIVSACVWPVQVHIVVNRIGISYRFTFGWKTEPDHQRLGVPAVRSDINATHPSRLAVGRFRKNEPRPPRLNQAPFRFRRTREPALLSPDISATNCGRIGDGSSFLHTSSKLFTIENPLTFFTMMLGGSCAGRQTMMNAMPIPTDTKSKTVA